MVITLTRRPWGVEIGCPYALTGTLRDAMAARGWPLSFDPVGGAWRVVLTEPAHPDGTPAGVAVADHDRLWRDARRWAYAGGDEVRTVHPRTAPLPDRACRACGAGEELARAAALLTECIRANDAARSAAVLRERRLASMTAHRDELARRVRALESAVPTGVPPVAALTWLAGLARSGEDRTALYRTLIRIVSPDRGGDTGLAQAVNAILRPGRPG